jgi:hypothetical protein
MQEHKAKLHLLPAPATAPDWFTSEAQGTEMPSAFFDHRSISLRSLSGSLCLCGEPVMAR